MITEQERSVVIGLGAFIGGFAASQGFIRGMFVLGWLGVALLVLVTLYIFRRRWGSWL